MMAALCVHMIKHELRLQCANFFLLLEKIQIEKV
jgi:hypothetical protein